LFLIIGTGGELDDDSVSNKALDDTENPRLSHVDREQLWLLGGTVEPKGQICLSTDHQLQRLKPEHPLEAFMIEVPIFLAIPHFLGQWIH